MVVNFYLSYHSFSYQPTWYVRYQITCLSTSVNVIAKTNKQSLLAGDHLADGSMKNVASYDKRCKLQNTPNTWSSNAYCGLASPTNPCLCEGCKEKDETCIVWWWRVYWTYTLLSLLCIRHDLWLYARYHAYLKTAYKHTALSMVTTHMFAICISLLWAAVCNIRLSNHVHNIYHNLTSGKITRWI